jgi:hypothetical protein
MASGYSRCRGFRKQPLQVPAEFEHVGHEVNLTPERILGLSTVSTRNFRTEAFCSAAAGITLRRIEEDFGKGLGPIVCRGLHNYRSNAFKIKLPSTCVSRKREFYHIPQARLT